ncbi:putative quinol monooxygenase [Cupriavidus sp. AcVe19-6a]|uniref:putative quinol monooxygenase n=1 Tax=Cupriavidus sp. AcVe19-6a TaxID=2821358 RepID=UPI001AE7FF6D|nr:antibiotic biosynthesis monooxygenase [Cupriavidus sp. AcVe19-6a]MBP0637996.1 antibiotic biosynthesis monooxygenase [Cupriavidus sp. AcVe19-6a]
MKDGHVVTVCFKVRPEHVDDFRHAIVENAHASLCLEFGCLVFDVCEDVTRQEFYLYEVYASPDAFAEHLASGHFKSFDAASSQWITDKKVAQYTRLTVGVPERNHLEV